MQSDRPHIQHVCCIVAYSTIWLVLVVFNTPRFLASCKHLRHRQTVNLQGNPSARTLSSHNDSTWHSLMIYLRKIHMAHHSS